jgi:DNA-binding MarR family transcriptional regulator
MSAAGRLSKCEKISSMRVTVDKKDLLVNGSDREFRDFIFDLLAFIVRMNEVRAGYGQRLGLTGSGFAMLVSISHQQGEQGVSVNAVAEHLHLSGSFVTLEVGKLTNAGLVKKRRCTEDRRRVLLTLTPKGRRQLGEVAEIQGPVNAVLFEAMSRDDFQRMGRMLKNLVPCGDRAITLLNYLSASNPLEADSTPRAAGSAGSRAH